MSQFLYFYVWFCQSKSLTIYSPYIQACKCVFSICGIYICALFVRVLCPECTLRGWIYDFENWYTTIFYDAILLLPSRRVFNVQAVPALVVVDNWHVVVHAAQSSSTAQHFPSHICRRLHLLSVVCMWFLLKLSHTFQHTWCKSNSSLKSTHREILHEEYKPIKPFPPNAYMTFVTWKSSAVLLSGWVKQIYKSIAFEIICISWLGLAVGGA